jgi:integrase
MFDDNGVAADDVRRWLTSLQGNVAPSIEYRNYSGLRNSVLCRRRARRFPDGQRPPAEGARAAHRNAHARPDARTLADCSGRDFVSRRDTAIILPFADTGGRLSELAKLTTSDVDLRGRVACVVGKGRRPRTVPFGARTAHALDRYLRLRRQYATADRPNLWLGERNRAPLTVEGIKQMLRRRGENIGVRVRTHMFRHRFADAWLKAGGPRSLFNRDGETPRLRPASGTRPRAHAGMIGFADACAPFAVVVGDEADVPLDRRIACFGRFGWLAAAARGDGQHGEGHGDRACHR